MSTRNNEVLGYTECSECNERATVHQTKRGKGRFLYTRCACGCDQRTGAAVQTRLYNNAEWLGDAPEPPPNLIKPKVQEPEKQPESEPKPQPKEEPRTTEKKPLLLALATGTTIALLALLGRKT